MVAKFLMWDKIITNVFFICCVFCIFVRWNQTSVLSHLVFAFASSASCPYYYTKMLISFFVVLLVFVYEQKRLFCVTVIKVGEMKSTNLYNGK